LALESYSVVPLKVGRDEIFHVVLKDLSWDRIAVLPKSSWLRSSRLQIPVVLLSPPAAIRKTLRGGRGRGCGGLDGGSSTPASGRGPLLSRRC